MRTPRSNFVVEYKSSKRQTKARPSSIWGNLDLQAVARAVEADGAVAEIHGPRSSSPPQDGAEATNPVAASDIFARPEDLLKCRPCSAESETTPVAVKDDETFDETSLREPLPLAPAQPPKSRANSPVGNRRSGIKERTASLHYNASVDMIEEELAALEAENGFLRRLMIAKLREDNDRLTSMLLRFRGV